METFWKNKTKSSSRIQNSSYGSLNLKAEGRMYEFMRDNTRHEHKTFTPIEENMIIYFNTGNLVFKDMCPNMFKGKYEERWCLFTACEGRDHYHHVRYQCNLYSTKYRDIQVVPINLAHHICVFLRNLNWSQSYWIYSIWLPLVWQFQNGVNHLCRSKQIRPRPKLIAKFIEVENIFINLIL